MVKYSHPLSHFRDILYDNRATTKTLPDKLVLQLQKLRMQNAKKTWPSKQLTTFNQWQSRPLVYMPSPLPLFSWVALHRNLLMCLMISGTTQGCTSASSWLWSEETLPTHWHLGKVSTTFPAALFSVDARFEREIERPQRGIKWPVPTKQTQTNERTSSEQNIQC